MARVAAFALLLTVGFPFAAQAQNCVPTRNSDWMTDTLLNRQSPLYNPGAAWVRPGDCQRVEQSPPDFSWPHLSGTAQYEVTLTFPDNHTKTLTAPQTWINWDEVLPPGNYSWQVQAGTNLSNVRRFTVSANAVPFLVPDMTSTINQLLAKAHPRGLPDPATLALMASQRGSLALPALRWQVAGNLNEPLPPAGARGDGYVYGRKALKSLMAYVYDGTDTYKEDARVRVLSLASWDPRGQTATDDIESVFVAWVVTLGYDWLGSGLNASDRTQVLSMLSTRIGDLYGWITGSSGWPFGSTFTLAPLWQEPRDSHRELHAGVVATMSTLLVGDLPEANTWVQNLLPFALNLTSPWSGEEGGYANGTAYGMWNVGAQLSAWYALRWATCGSQQTCIDLAQKAWVRNYGRFLAYFVPPTARTTDLGNPTNTNDPGTPIGLFGDGFAEGQLFEERARFGKGYSNFAPSALGCWYSSTLVGEDTTTIEYLMSPPYACASTAFPPGTSNSLYLPSTGWMAMHSDLSDPTRISVYFKSSPLPFGAYEHQSADQNAFVVNAGGERLAIESGYYGDYDGYNTNHWQWWLKRTRSKNAITFDGGRGQIAWEHQPNPYLSANARYGSITQQQSAAEYDIVTGDATDAYDGALTKAVRSLVYLRPSAILVYENLASGTPRTWEWNIHALNPITVIDSSSRVQVTRGTQSLCVDALAGPGGAFTPINAEDYRSWGTADDGVTSDAPLDPNAPAQYHGKFTSAQSSTAVEFIALLRVGCQPSPSSATKTNGVWTVLVGNRTVTIGDSGISVQ